VLDMSQRQGRCRCFTWPSPPPGRCCRYTRQPRVGPRLWAQPGQCVPAALSRFEPKPAGPPETPRPAGSPGNKVKSIDEASRDTWVLFQGGHRTGVPGTAALGRTGSLAQDVGGGGGVGSGPFRGGGPNSGSQTGRTRLVETAGPPGPAPARKGRPLHQRAAVEAGW